MIMVTPENLIKFFYENTEVLKDRMILVAANDDESGEIYLTEYESRPVLCVEMDGLDMLSKTIWDLQKAEDEYEKLIKAYISDEDQDEDEGQECVDFESCFSSEQIDRRDDIACSVDDMIHVMIQKDVETSGVFEADVFELAEEIAKMIHQKWGFDIWFPVAAESDDGEIIVDDWPCMDEPEAEGEV